MKKAGTELLKLGVVLIGLYWLIVSLGTSSSYSSPPQPSPRKAISALPESPSLRLESFRNERSSTDYMKVIGEVTNLTSSPIDKIQAVAKWYDKSDNLIVSDTTLIDYQPLMGNQSSPFHVLSRYNPAMSYVRIDFKKFWGDSIQFEVKPKPTPSKKGK